MNVKFHSKLSRAVHVMWDCYEIPRETGRGAPMLKVLAQRHPQDGHDPC